MSHCDGTKYGLIGHTRLTINPLSSLTPTPIPLQKHCKLYFYISKTNQMFLSRLIIHITKVSFWIMMCVLTVYLMQTNEPKWAQTSMNKAKRCDQVMGTSTNEYRNRQGPVQLSGCKWMAGRVQMKAKQAWPGSRSRSRNSCSRAEAGAGVGASAATGVAPAAGAGYYVPLPPFLFFFFFFL